MIKLFFFFSFFLGLTPSQSSAPPSGTWEAWIIALRTGAPRGLPGRPDGKNLTDPLPLWVDCHLSWLLDHPEYQKKISPLGRKVILRSTPRACAGQLEQWAHLPKHF